MRKNVREICVFSNFRLASYISPIKIDFLFIFIHLNTITTHNST